MPLYAGTWIDLPECAYKVPKDPADIFLAQRYTLERQLHHVLAVSSKLGRT